MKLTDVEHPVLAAMGRLLYRLAAEQGSTVLALGHTVSAAAGS